MLREGVCDALVAGGFVGPAAGLGVGFQGLDVGELVGEGPRNSGAVM